MIFVIYVTHNDEINSLKEFFLDLLKSEGIMQLGGGGWCVTSTLYLLLGQSQENLPNLPW